METIDIIGTIVLSTFGLLAIIVRICIGVWQMKDTNPNNRPIREDY